MVFSNFLQTVYNLTDTFFLGRLPNDARDAVAIAGMAFPLIWFISSFGFGFVVGGIALISQSKGRGDLVNIKKLFSQFILILVAGLALFILFKAIFVTKILVFLNTPKEIFESALFYIGLIMDGMIFMFIMLLYQSFAHGMGDTITPMKIQIISIAINIILDPILIFGLVGFEKMGVKGAAISTLIARIVAAILAVIYFVKGYREYLPEFKDLLPNKVLLRKILKVSIPASLAQSTSAFGFVVLQGFINFYGTVAISVYSISSRITSFYLMPASGISGALSTIVGQNLGAGKIERAEQSFKVTMKSICLVMFTGAMIIWLFSSSLIAFFIEDPEVIKEGARIVKLAAVGSLIFGGISAFNGLFNGAGLTKPTMHFTIARLWLFRIPLVYLLSGYLLNYGFVKNLTFLSKLIKIISSPLAVHPYDALWWAMIISNILALIWAYLLYKKESWKSYKI